VQKHRYVVFGQQLVKTYLQSLWLDDPTPTTISPFPLSTQGSAYHKSPPIRHQLLRRYSPRQMLLISSSYTPATALSCSLSHVYRPHSASTPRCVEAPPRQFSDSRTRTRAEGAPCLAPTTIASYCSSADSYVIHSFSCTKAPNSERRP
jgi:hypothetical protein